MILVTGGTGFIGRALIRQLVSMGHPVRILVRPSPQTPNLPKGISLDVAVCSLKDERGLRAAMKGVQTVYHLAGTEKRGSRADLLSVDIHGTQAVAQAARDVGVNRIFYLSHLGADRASAYPLMKAKAIAESRIRNSGVDYTIIRSGVVFGQQDGFTTGLAMLMHAFPGIFLMPSDGSTLIQPLWVEDLAACLCWALDIPASLNQIYSLGGTEYLTFRQICEMTMETTNIQRWLLPVSPAYLRGITVLFEHIFPNFPVSVFWLDYLAADRTCALDTIPRVFGLLPARLGQHLDHLQNQFWQRNLLRLLIQGHRAI
jgi:uncharacterized protein YbjT (DUF2867 family)